MSPLKTFILFRFNVIKCLYLFHWAQYSHSESVASSYLIVAGPKGSSARRCVLRLKRVLSYRQARVGVGEQSAGH